MTAPSAPPMIARIEETHIPGPHGDIRVRTYCPSHPTGAGIVWIHGGAFSMNDIDVPEAHWVAQKFAEAGIAVVSPDYRLANDGVHFPVLTDECRTAWVWAQRGEGFAHVERWHLGGGSAGGNLAAAVAMELRDTDAPEAPASNVLVYPAMHSPFPEPRAELAAKMRTLPPEELYSPDQIRRVNLNYVGDPALLQHPLAFPGHGQLEGMPPTLIINAEFDQIRSSGELYGSQLALAGVDTLILREPSARHGYLNHPEERAALRTVERMIAWMLATASGACNTDQ